jgi:hypothetical protein
VSRLLKNFLEKKESQLKTVGKVASSVPIMPLNCGEMNGLRRKGGTGIGDGGSISTGILFTSLIRLQVLLG